MPTQSQIAAVSRWRRWWPCSVSQPLHICTILCAGLIPDIVDAFPEVEVCGSKVAMMYLQGLTNREMKTKVMKGGDVLDLGQGGHI